MKLFINFQFGEFHHSSPNWFDWLTLFLTLGSIIGAYLIAEYTYSKEKKDKINENIELINSENDLLVNNLKELNKVITKQIESLKKYYDIHDFRLSVYSSIQVDFLESINVKNIYKKYNFENRENIKIINKLFTSLYSLYDFRISLKNDVRTYIERYNYHENQFYKYRGLLYTKYFELCNIRAGEIINDEGVKKFSFKPNDKFMKEYTLLRDNTFKDNEIINENGLTSRDLLIERFIKPLIEISSQYIPEDYNAIEICEIANQTLAAYTDMEHITAKHMDEIRGHIDSLEHVTLIITEFEKLRKLEIDSKI